MKKHLASTAPPGAKFALHCAKSHISVGPTSAGFLVKDRRAEHERRCAHSVGVGHHFLAEGSV